MQVTAEELERRRLIEDELVSLGADRERIAHADSWNRARIRRLIEPAREVGIAVRDIARMTGLSTQTLHNWKGDLMRPIPDIHYGLLGPTPQTLEEAVLRTMGEDIEREWTAIEIRERSHEIRERSRADWPSGSAEQVERAMEQLARGHIIWDGAAEGRYRVAPPADLQMVRTGS
jgi:hypothetical protein